MSTGVMESADETCDEQAGRIVQDDTESNDGGCGYPAGDIPSSDMQPERARVSTVCWPSEAPSGLRLCAPNTTGSIYEFVHDAETSNGIRAYPTGGTSSIDTQPDDEVSKEVHLCASKACVLVVYSHTEGRERMFF